MTYAVGGLANGAIIALVAVGIVLVFRATSVVNFAQGELLMIGAYAKLAIPPDLNSPVLSILVPFAAGVLGGTLFFGVTHYLLRGRDPIVVVAGTLALMILLQAAARLIYTDNPRPGSPWLFGNTVIELSGANVPANSLVTLAFTVLVGGSLYVWFRFNTIGKAMLAVAEDQHRAALAGIPVSPVLWLSWAIGGGLAAAAGVLVAPVVGVYPTMGAVVLFPAFIAAFMGGLDSVAGALIGGLVLGLVQTYAVVMVGGTYRDLVVFGLLVLVLLFRPSGLLGSASLRRF